MYSLLKIWCLFLNYLCVLLLYKPDGWPPSWADATQKLSWPFWRPGRPGKRLNCWRTWDDKHMLSLSLHGWNMLIEMMINDVYLSIITSRFPAPTGTGTRHDAQPDSMWSIGVPRPSDRHGPAGCPPDSNGSPPNASAVTHFVDAWYVRLVPGGGQRYGKWRAHI